MQAEDHIEFTLIAGNDEQYSNTLTGSAQELNVIDYPLHNIEFLGEHGKFEEFIGDGCFDDFIRYYGSSDEFGGTQEYKIKVIRNDKIIIDTSV